ncbi:MAG: ABC transporter permease [Ornithinimicrobium sp.]
MSTDPATRPPRRALSPEASAARARVWGSWYYAQTRLRAMRAYAVSILLSAVAEPVLYLTAMGIGLGTLVDTQNGDVNGVPYLVFVAPALLVASLVASVGSEMSYPVMDGFKWGRNYYGPAATAITPAQIAQGHFLAVLLRFVAQASVFWLIMLAFGAVQAGWSVLAIPIGVLSAAAFGAPLQAYAATLVDEGYQFAFIERFVVMPMFLFAGTFFPLSAMPFYLQWVGWISPVWHGTQLARVAAYRADEPGWLIAVHLTFLIVCTLVGLRWARSVYTRRLEG